MNKNGILLAAAGSKTKLTAILVACLALTLPRGAGALDCTLPSAQQLMGNMLTVQQIVNPVDQTMTAVLTYQGDGWLGLGVPDPTSYNPPSPPSPPPPYE